MEFKSLGFCYIHLKESSVQLSNSSLIGVIAIYELSQVLLFIHQLIVMYLTMVWVDLG